MAPQHWGLNYFVYTGCIGIIQYGFYHVPYMQEGDVVRWQRAYLSVSERKKLCCMLSWLTAVV